MKSRLKRFWDYLDGVYGLLLILYCSLVFGTQAVLANESFTDILRGIFLAVFFSVLLCPLLLRWVKKLRSLPDGQQAANGKDRIWKAAFFLIPLLVMLVYFAAYYPGGFATDVVNQYGQAVKGQYDNWHPVIHTLFAHKLPDLPSGFLFIYQRILQPSLPVQTVVFIPVPLCVVTFIVCTLLYPNT